MESIIVILFQGECGYYLISLQRYYMIIYDMRY